MTLNQKKFGIKLKHRKTDAFLLQDAKGNKVGVSVRGIKYDGSPNASTIDVTLDLKLWCRPTFDIMKLVEKLGRNINDMKL